MASCNPEVQTTGKGTRGICRGCQVSSGYGTKEQAQAWVDNHTPNPQSS